MMLTEAGCRVAASIEYQRVVVLSALPRQGLTTRPYWIERTLNDGPAPTNPMSRRQGQL